MTPRFDPWLTRPTLRGGLLLHRTHWQESMGQNGRNLIERRKLLTGSMAVNSALHGPAQALSHEDLEEHEHRQREGCETGVQ